MTLAIILLEAAGLNCIIVDMAIPGSQENTSSIIVVLPPMYKNGLWTDGVGVDQLNHQLFYRLARMAFLAVLAKEILPGLLVVTISAAYCRWTM